MIVAYTLFNNHDKDDLSSPEPHLHDTGKGYIKPDPSHIISRNKEGLVVSRYGDNIWDLTPYSRKTIKLHFEDIHNSDLRYEAKRLIYIYIAKTEGRGRGRVSGQNILDIYLSGVKKVIDYCDLNHLSLELFFENNKIIRSYIKYQGENADYCLRTFRIILNLLDNMSASRSGFNYKHNAKNKKILNKLIDVYERRMSQTELIPVEIYANAAKLRWDHISNIEKNLDGIVGFLNEMLRNENFAYSPNACKVHKNGKTARWETIEGFVPWKEAAKQYNLIKIFDQFDIDQRPGFIGFIKRIQGTCRHLIHMYTGMRDNECRSLSHDCFLEADGELPHRIQGIETKVHGRPTRQVWITHYEIKRVIDILNRLSGPIFEKFTPYLDEQPLIMATGFISGHKREEKYEYQGATAVSLGKSSKGELPLDQSSITLTQEQYDNELLAFQPDRDWTKHKWIKVGNPWNFTSHQYRRSLAVYALGSGLVSLFALKEQFGHLFKVMTEHYGNGHLVANKIFETDHPEHLVNHMKKLSYYVEAMTFTKEVSLSQEMLFGGGGVHYDKHAVAKTPEAKEAVLKNLPSTIKKVKNGEIRWHDNPLGGCVSLYPCDKYLFPTFFIHCRDCPESVQKISKIERMITVQQKRVDNLAITEQDSIVHRTEVNKLVEMENYVEFLKKKRSKKEKES